MSRLPHLAIEDSGLMCKHDRLHTVAKVELLEDVRDVRLDRRFADVELSADFTVRQAAGHEAKDVAFAFAEVVDLLRRRGTGKPGELLNDALRDRR